jgi:hypothetical protein
MFDDIGRFALRHHLCLFFALQMRISEAKAHYENAQILADSSRIPIITSKLKERLEQLEQNHGSSDASTGA